MKLITVSSAADIKLYSRKRNFSKAAPKRRIKKTKTPSTLVSSQHNSKSLRKAPKVRRQKTL
jgi:hypothetical protein